MPTIDIILITATLDHNAKLRRLHIDASGISIDTELELMFIKFNFGI